MTNREFHSEEFYKWMVKNFEEIRQRRKKAREKPDIYDKLEIELDRMFSSIYRKLL